MNRLIPKKQTNAKNRSAVYRYRCRPPPFTLLPSHSKITKPSLLVAKISPKACWKSPLFSPSVYRCYFCRNHRKHKLEISEIFLPFVGCYREEIQEVFCGFE
ncbi:hypothetical protein SLEP1_g36292 [Rubroshorea leprosula]|uniref:Uncharacterized protein n=1 Tax=Rubroshorea leprosula TaxID=152421 RepID=A0AAV5KRI3_9ROSI|nr:hypothetical protein SLEP1_g36292 [Rubroshorea leprosula]